MFQFCTKKTIIANFCHLIFAFAKKIRLTVDGDILQKNTTQMNHSVKNLINEKKSQSIVSNINIYKFSHKIIKSVKTVNASLTIAL